MMRGEGELNIKKQDLTQAPSWPLWPYAVSCAGFRPLEKRLILDAKITDKNSESI